MKALYDPGQPASRPRRPKFTEGVHMSAKQALVHAIKSEMEHQGISRKNLARRLGCTQENIAQLLDDQRHGTRLDTAERLASALGRRLFLALIPETSLETTEFVVQLLLKVLDEVQTPSPLP